MKRTLASLVSLLTVIVLMGAEPAAIPLSQRIDSEAVVNDTIRENLTSASVPNIPYEGYKRLMITPKIGLGVSEICNSASELDEYFDLGFAALIGADVEVGLKGGWTFASGLQLMSQSSSESANDVRIDLHRIVMQVPVGFAYRIRLHPDWRLRLGLGAFVSLGLGGKEKAGYLGHHEENNIYGGDHGMRRFDAGMELNYHIEYRRFIVGVCVDGGFVRLYRDCNYNSLSTVFTIGYRL